MNNFEINSIPKIRFAHTHSNEKYDNRPKKRSSFIEITYIAEGSLLCEWGGQQEMLEKGDVLCNFYQGDLILTTPTFHEHHTVGIIADWSESTDEINSLYLPLVTKADTNIYKVHQIIDELIHDTYFYKKSTANGAAKVLSLLCELSHYNRKNNPQNLPGEVLYTQRAKEYINRNLHLPITQKEVAEHLSISPEYLCYVFKKATGISIMKYTNMTKLHAMRNLMEKENLYLYEAASLFGYSDPNYVSRLFRKLFGFNITNKEASRQ